MNTAMTLLLLSVGLAGCMGTTAPASPTIATRGSQTVVYIEGRGTVTSQSLGIHCGPTVPDDVSKCAAEAGVRAKPRLVATPESGWAFDRWEWRRLGAACDPAFLFGGIDREGGPTYAYTAVFIQTGHSSHASNRTMR